MTQFDKKMISYLFVSKIHALVLLDGKKLWPYRNPFCYHNFCNLAVSIKIKLHFASKKVSSGKYSHRPVFAAWREKVTFESCCRIARQCSNLLQAY